MKNSNSSIDNEHKYHELDLLYAGYVAYNRPERAIFRKWHVSVDEYPYDRYPPFVMGGSYILSNKALKKFYYATFYVKPFRVDDVYLGMLAYKLEIDPYHNPQFWCCRKYPHNPQDYQYTVVSHEFSDPAELYNIWNQQREAGNA